MSILRFEKYKYLAENEKGTDNLWLRGNSINAEHLLLCLPILDLPYEIKL